MILFLSMSIVTQCIKQSKYTILRENEKNMLGGGRRGSGFLSILFFFFQSKHKTAHSYQVSPPPHNLDPFKVEGGGGWGK